VRLTAAAAVGMAAALALAGAVLVLVLRHNLLSSVDTSARQRASEVAGLVAARGRADLPPATDETIVQVQGNDGRVLAAAPGAAHLPVPSAVEGRVRSVRGAVVGGESDSYRVFTATVPGGRARVAAAASSDDVADSIRQLIALLLVGLPVVLAVLVGTTWLLVGRALAPVETLRRQAAAIPGQDLRQRVDVPRSGDELARLAMTLNDLLARAADALARQRAFVADAAHELRTPLAGLLTRLDLRQRWPDEDGEPLQDVRPQVLRMSRLVDELLTLARLDTQQPALRLVDLDDIVLAEVADARAWAQVTAPDLHLEVRMSPARVCGNPLTLQRVVRNLLDNAVRYARRTVTVTLAVTPSPNGSPGHAVLVVSDDGAGIRAQDAERVFDRFTRLDESRDRDSGGAGLGLAIVREVVRAHGGRVTLEPGEPGEPGARFVVMLPLEASLAGA
jgi:signal transduction histidine kinase